MTKQCEQCKGHGQICTGDSGTEADGYAPTIEHCEACDGSGYLDVVICVICDQPSADEVGTCGRAKCVDAYRAATDSEF